MIIDNIIKNRKTEKVLAESPWNITTNPEELEKTINELLDLAKYAPYHKKCHTNYSETENELNSCVPWRFYVLDTKNCRKLYEYIDQESIKAGKVSNMLAAADALLLATWLPEPPEMEEMNSSSEIQTAESFPFQGNIRNMEHIAACSAAIQNVLVGATARNIPNYWSSGGQLRNFQLRQYLDISLKEILLGALFLFPKDAADREAIIKEGSMRHQGKEKSSWSKWINLNT